MSVFDVLREKLEERRVLHNELSRSDKLTNEEKLMQTRLDGCFCKSIEIVNQVEQEYNNDFCEWEYDEFEDGWQTSCDTVFSLCDSDKEITNFCPCCGKKIKVVEE